MKRLVIMTVLKAILVPTSLCLFLSACVSPGGADAPSSDTAAWNNVMRTMLSTAPDGIQRKQDIISASQADRDAHICAGDRWTAADENRRVRELNQNLQQNSVDWANAFLGQLQGTR